MRMLDGEESDVRATAGKTRRASTSRSMHVCYPAAAAHKKTMQSSLSSYSATMTRTKTAADVAAPAVLQLRGAERALIEAYWSLVLHSSREPPLYHTFSSRYGGTHGLPFATRHLAAATAYARQHGATAATSAAEATRTAQQHTVSSSSSAMLSLPPPLSELLAHADAHTPQTTRAALRYAAAEAQTLQQRIAVADAALLLLRSDDDGDDGDSHDAHEHNNDKEGLALAQQQLELALTELQNSDGGLSLAELTLSRAAVTAADKDSNSGDGGGGVGGLYARRAAQTAVVLHKLARVAMLRHENARALQLLCLANDADPLRADTYVLRAVCHERLAQPRAAYDEYVKYMKLCTPSLAVLAHCGTCAVQAGELDAAEAHLRTLLQLATDAQRVHDEADTNDGDTATAAAAATHATTDDASFFAAHAHYYLGEVYERRARQHNNNNSSSSRSSNGDGDKQCTPPPPTQKDTRTNATTPAMTVAAQLALRQRAAAHVAAAAADDSFVRSYEDAVWRARRSGAYAVACQLLRRLRRMRPHCAAYCVQTAQVHSRVGNVAGVVAALSAALDMGACAATRRAMLLQRGLVRARVLGDLDGAIADFTLVIGMSRAHDDDDRDDKYKDDNNNNNNNEEESDAAQAGREVDDDDDDDAEDMPHSALCVVCATPARADECVAMAYLQRAKCYRTRYTRARHAATTPTTTVVAAAAAAADSHACCRDDYEAALCDYRIFLQHTVADGEGAAATATCTSYASSDARATHRGTRQQQEQSTQTPSPRRRHAWCAEQHIVDAMIVLANGAFHRGDYVTASSYFASALARGWRPRPLPRQASSSSLSWRPRVLLQPRRATQPPQPAAPCHDGAATDAATLAKEADASRRAAQRLRAMVARARRDDTDSVPDKDTASERPGDDDGDDDDDDDAKDMHDVYAEDLYSQMYLCLAHTVMARHPVCEDVFKVAYDAREYTSIVVSNTATTASTATGAVAAAGAAATATATAGATTTMEARRLRATTTTTATAATAAAVAVTAAASTVSSSSGTSGSAAAGHNSISSVSSSCAGAAAGGGGGGVVVPLVGNHAHTLVASSNTVSAMTTVAALPSLAYWAVEARYTALRALEPTVFSALESAFVEAWEPYRSEVERTRDDALAARAGAASNRRVRRHGTNA